MRTRNDNNDSGQKSSHQAALAVWVLGMGMLPGRKARRRKENRNGENSGGGSGLRIEGFHYLPGQCIEIY